MHCLHHGPGREIWQTLVRESGGVFLTLKDVSTLVYASNSMQLRYNRSKYFWLRISPGEKKVFRGASSPDEQATQAISSHHHHHQQQQQQRQQQQQQCSRPTVEYDRQFYLNCGKFDFYFVFINALFFQSRMCIN